MGNKVTNIIIKLNTDSNVVTKELIGFIEKINLKGTASLVSTQIFGKALILKNLHFKNKDKPQCIEKYYKDFNLLDSKTMQLKDIFI